MWPVAVAVRRRLLANGVSSFAAPKYMNNDDNLSCLGSLDEIEFFQVVRNRKTYQ